MSIALRLNSEIRRRWPVLLAGYIAASLVGGAAIVLLMLLTWSGPSDIDMALLSVTSMLVSFVALLVFVFALIPSIVMLIYAGRHSIRSPGWYAVAGMAIAVLGCVLHLLVSAIFGPPPTEGLTSVFKALLFESIVTVPAGLCAGLTFWAIAGRRMGEQRQGNSAILAP